MIFVLIYYTILYMCSNALQYSTVHYSTLHTLHVVHYIHIIHYSTILHHIHFFVDMLVVI